MTYSACRRKFPQRKLTSRETPEEIEQLRDTIRRGIPADKRAVLPVWNSNTGKIQLAEPEKLIFDMVSSISELWCNRIIFPYVKMPYFERTPRKIGSAKVARQQCSKFLEGESLAKDFSEYLTTTSAVADLRGGKIEGALCSRELAKALSLKILREDCSNPLNATTFAEFVKWEQTEGNVHLAAVEMPRLDMGKTTQIHEEIMMDIFEDVAEFSHMPKIIFAMELREDKYGLLIEFPDFPKDGSPLSPAFNGKADVKVVNRVGRLLKDFSSRACDYMGETFCDDTWPDFASYGLHGAYFCICPALDIFVQGYDPNIVKEIALLSLEKHVDLFAQSVEHPDSVARGLLGQLFKRVQAGEIIQDFVEFTPLAE